MEEFLGSAALARIAPSPTLAATQKARDLAASGKDIISLAAGEPDFDTPEHIKAAAIEAIKRGETKYTAVDGTPELKAAIAAKFARDNGLSFRAQQISVAPGGKAVIYNAFLATLNPGDEVIVPAPYWASYPDIARLAGGAPVIVPTREEDGFLLTPEVLARTITPRTRWLILNSPANPTGAVYDAEALLAIADVLRTAEHVMTLSDDIYEKLIYDDRQFATLASVAPDLSNRILTMNGASKAYAMTGWRIGYAGGPAPLIKAMAKVMSQTTGNPSSISQAAAAAALNADQAFLDDWRRAFQRRRDATVAMINDAAGLSCATPGGAFYIFASCSGAIGARTPDGREITCDVDFADALLDAEGVAIVAGAAFGASPYIRLSYAASDVALAEACSRIRRFCDRLS
ncbi:MAG: pyridoxal phosphate-dependent aminotransferase [Pseudomonadota bacterium]